MKKEKTEDDIDNLVKQMKELKTLMIGTQKGNNNYNRNIGRNRDYDIQNIICYKCGEKGHYASRCENNNDQNNKIICSECGKQGYLGKNCKKKEVRFSESNRGRRNINFLNMSYDEEIQYTDEKSSEDEREIYELGKRKQDEYMDNEEKLKDKFSLEQRKQNKLTLEQRRQKQTEALRKGRDIREKNNICNLCDQKGHFATNCERLVCTRCYKKGHTVEKCPTRTKERKTRKNEMEIDKQTEEKYKLAEHVIKDLPKMIKKKDIYESLRKYNEKSIRYLQKNGKPRYKPVTSEINIQGIETEAIIDSGAAATVMTKGLLEELPYEINSLFRANLIPFGEGRYTSIGIIEGMEFFVGNMKTSMDVEVVDLPEKMLLLGVD
jgi:hypothetical protein